MGVHPRRFRFNGSGIRLGRVELGCLGLQQARFGLDRIDKEMRPRSRSKAIAFWGLGYGQLVIPLASIHFFMALACAHRDRRQLAHQQIGGSCASFRWPPRMSRVRHVYVGFVVIRLRACNSSVAVSVRVREKEEEGIMRPGPAALRSTLGEAIRGRRERGIIHPMSWVGWHCGKTRSPPPGTCFGQKKRCPAFEILLLLLLGTRERQQRKQPEISEREQQTKKGRRKERFIANLSFSKNTYREKSPEKLRAYRPGPPIRGKMNKI